MSKKPAKKRRSDEPPAEIAIVGELFEESEGDIIKSLLEIPPGEPVIFYFDSAGGSVYTALAIAELIRLRKFKSTAVVLGECSSSALLVFAACQKRFVTERSVFLFHRVRWRSDKDVRSDEAANWAAHFQWLEHEIDRYQAEMFGIAKEKFDKWIETGRFLSGKELVDLGLAEFVSYE